MRAGRQFHSITWAILAGSGCFNPGSGDETGAATTTTSGSTSGSTSEAPTSTAGTTMMASSTGEPPGSTSTSTSTSSTTSGATTETGATSTGETGDETTADTTEPAVCGNGIVEKGEACDPDVAMFGCVGCHRTARFVFVTDGEWPGDQVGVEAGRMRCNEEAPTMPGFGEIMYTPWISEQGAPANERVLEAGVPFILFNGEIVAASHAMLLSGQLMAPINLTPSGMTLVNDMQDCTYPVWTGTTPEGAESTDRCNDWMAGDGVFGDAGVAIETAEGWTSGCQLECGKPARLYCFEVL